MVTAQGLEPWTRWPSPESVFVRVPRCVGAAKSSKTVGRWKANSGARTGRWRWSRAPRQRNDIPSGCQHVEAIGKALGKLDALGEIGRLIVCARRGVAGRVPQRSHADVRRRAEFAQHGSESSSQGVRRHGDAEPSLDLPRPFRSVLHARASGAGEHERIRLARPERLQHRD